ncbi:nascent polypeptide-associated complex protein [Conexivisphaera calida]|uniref:Nascent polypeptide-associated complex protein n=1 Tax=Conexivisphaera calida TaxID=1874277 RepID=A0A4P2VAK8_9ARCH|nr:nascent polypeptide-associated complex protein [Conexivisphaera calida]BBE41514.1 Nascent polypeptide-associated complex protein [Conexivisphaera calida]
MISNRQARRMMEKMGLNVEEIEGVKEVIMQMEGGRMIRVKDPTVYKLRTKEKDIAIYNVMGKEEVAEGEEEFTLSEEDVKLVMEQTGVTRDQAIQALVEAGGDLAAAILKLQQQSGN